MNSRQSKMSIGSDEQQYYFLQPMFQKHPPNEIISSKYAPDVVPFVKLITNQNEKKTNITYIPPKIKNQQLDSYASLFSFRDYLGLHYAKNISQLVFLKFNNQNYNTIAQTTKNQRLMSGFYVPFEQLSTTSIRDNNKFTKYLNTSYPEYHSNPLKSFCKQSNKGCSFDPLFSSNYQSANLFAVIRKNPFQYDLILQNDVNDCRQINWFNFAVQFQEQGYYSFNVVNMTADLQQIFKNGAKIAYSHISNWSIKDQKRAGEFWNFGGENITYEQSSIQKENKNCQYYFRLHFEFKCKNKHDIVMFALNAPYTCLQTQKFFNHMIFKKIRSMIQTEKIVIGKTICGTPLEAYLISRKKSKSQLIQNQTFQTEQRITPGKQKSINLAPLSNGLKSIFANNYDSKEKSMFFIGRQNASDIAGSYSIEGMVEYLMDNLEFESLKKAYRFYFIPTLNTDGVRFGNQKCNLTGCDLYKHWKNPHPDFQAQIFWLKRFMIEINKQFPISLIMDFANSKKQMQSTFVSILNQNEDDCEDNRIFPYVFSKRYKDISFENSQFMSKNENNSMCCVLSELFPRSSIFQIKISNYKKTKNQSRNSERLSQISSQEQFVQYNPDQFRNFGKQIISTYLEHIKLYEKNILLRDRWIKQIQSISAQTSVAKKKQFQQQACIEERFPLSFITLPRIYPSATKLLTIDSLMKGESNKMLDNKVKERNINSMIRNQDKKKTAPPQRSLNQFTIRKNQPETQPQSNKEMASLGNELKEIKPIIGQRPISLFRIGQKKTSILKNCPSNMLNFELQNTSKEKGRSSNNFEKQIFRKQNSSKILKKTRIQDTILSKNRPHNRIREFQNA